VTISNFDYPVYVFFVVLLPKVKINWLSNLSVLSVPDECYYRNVSCALNWISTFSLVTFVFFKLHICRYLVHVLCFICYNLYLFTYTVVLHDINNNNDVSRSTVTGRVALVEQKLLSLPEHMCSSPLLSGVRVAQSLVLCVMFCRLLFVFWSFSLGHCIFYLIRFMASDYPFGIFKLFMWCVTYNIYTSIKVSLLLIYFINIF
jgi:hypothetical protein